MVQLTEAGLRERAELDQRAEAFAHSLLAPLSEAQRVKLADTMAQVEQLLIASMVEITMTDPTSQDARWCFEHYFAELGERFEMGFDPTLSISAQAHELLPPVGLLLIARLKEEPIGCGALKFHDDAVGELKRMWVAPRARGLGLGRRLLQTLEHEAREAGMTILHLETNRTLMEAIDLYRRSGYQEVEPFNDEPYAHHWFEKRL
jgi:GNAT superfamily N-acetyltransferase